MKYYEIEAQVPGSFGPSGILSDPYARPPRIEKFAYEFDHWPQDPLAECIGCYIVTRPIAQKILAMHATGVSFGPVETSMSPTLEDPYLGYPGRQLPDFVWLQPKGRPGHDDFGMSLACKLVVSERVLTMLRSAGVSRCAVADFDPQRNR